MGAAQNPPGPLRQFTAISGDKAVLNVESPHQGNCQTRPSSHSPSSGSFFHPKPPSLPILLPEHGSERSQGRKRNPNPNLLVRIFSGGVGVFHVKGWGPKSSVCPSKPREKLFWRDIPGFCWDTPGVPEKFEEKRFVFNSRLLRKVLTKET